MDASSTTVLGMEESPAPDKQKAGDASATASNADVNPPPRISESPDPPPPTPTTAPTPASSRDRSLPAPTHSPVQQPRPPRHPHSQPRSHPHNPQSTYPLAEPHAAAHHHHHHHRRHTKFSEESEGERAVRNRSQCHRDDESGVASSAASSDSAPGTCSAARPSGRNVTRLLIVGWDKTRTNIMIALLALFAVWVCIFFPLLPHM